jgi:hypothetical protein
MKEPLSNLDTFDTIHVYHSTHHSYTFVGYCAERMPLFA